MVTAQQECRDFGHEQIGSEHLLLALIAASDGLAGQVLASLGIELDAARSELIAHFGRGAARPTGFLPFSTWAKSGIALSEREATQLGQEFVGTEHLLLGLIRIGKGGWLDIMHALGVDERDVRASVLGLIDSHDRGHGDLPPEDRAPVLLADLESGRVPFGTESSIALGGKQLFERFTESGRRIVVLAQEEARLLNHNYIGTEHILLGLLNDPKSLGARALSELGVELEVVRGRVLDTIGQGLESPSGHIPFTPRSKKAMELSLRESLGLGHDYIGTEHILLGLLREGDGVAAQILTKLGAFLPELRQTVLELGELLEHIEGVPKVAEGGIGLAPPPSGPPIRSELRGDARGGRVTRVHAQSSSPFEERYGFSRGIRHDSRIEIAGTAPIPPEGEEVAATAYEQMIRCGQIALEALVDLGGDPTDVIRTVMYITDASESDEIGRAHGELFGEAAPAATMVVVAGLLDPAWKVELEVYAQL